MWPNWTMLYFMKVSLPFFEFIQLSRRWHFQQTFEEKTRMRASLEFILLVKTILNSCIMFLYFSPQLTMIVLVFSTAQKIYWIFWNIQWKSVWVWVSEWVTNLPTHYLLTFWTLQTFAGKDSGLKMHDNVKHCRDERKEGALVAWNVRPNDAHGQEHGRQKSTDCTMFWVLNNIIKNIDVSALQCFEMFIQLTAPVWRPVTSEPTLQRPKKTVRIVEDEQSEVIFLSSGRFILITLLG